MVLISGFYDKLQIIVLKPQVRMVFNSNTFSEIVRNINWRCYYKNTINKDIKKLCM